MPSSNVSFWPLSYLVWYYVLFGVAHYARRPLKQVLIAAIAVLIGPKILLLLPVWLLGLWAHRVSFAKSVPERIGWLLFAGSIVGYVLFWRTGAPAALTELTARELGPALDRRLGWSNIFIRDYAIGALVSLNVIGFAAVGPRLGFSLEPWRARARFLGRLAFPAYLFHFPLLLFFAALTASGLHGWSRSLVIVSASLAVIAVLGMLLDAWRAGMRRRVDDLICTFSQRLSGRRAS